MEQDGERCLLVYFATDKKSSRMRQLFCFLGLIACFSPPLGNAQLLTLPVVHSTPSPWKAVWITHPDISGNEYAVVNFRKELHLETKPSQFIISVSADN